MGAFSIPPRPLTANDAGFNGANNMPHRTPVGCQCMGDRRAHSARGTGSRRRPVHTPAQGKAGLPVRGRPSRRPFGGTAPGRARLRGTHEAGFFQSRAISAIQVNGGALPCLP